MEEGQIRFLPLGIGWILVLFIEMETAGIGESFIAW